ncbi:MAG: phospholipid carrier-dependent glycosyltransferase [Caldilineaceae bacterium]|nr:phospholipid carrier-dependent glycosyltransferase [Caldilineaceae bacterium]MBP8110282.1 phospholipid carrier-dependent glycosyltransferase [Caldilineaceae bacterium]MBP8124325.1 phospholipid carrier-dependent glycosyltransferase [Caldilineaceae bacterium]MBP9074309.1 phospholipid carrier-dependent glycosyltransferase [Caldilineaceae bacterium]
MSESQKTPLPSPPQIGEGADLGARRSGSSPTLGEAGRGLWSHRILGMLLLAGLLYSVYTFTNAGRFHIIDEVSLYGVTESVARRGTVDTNAIAWTQWVNSPGEVLGAFGPDGDVFSKKGPGPAFAALRAYGVTWAGRALGLKWGLLQGVLLWNGFLTALTAVLLWLTVLRLGYRDRTGMIMGLLFGLGTIAWPYANHLFGEPLSAFSLLLCFYGIVSFHHKEHKEHKEIRKSPFVWVAGLGAGLAIATVTAYAVLVGILGLLLAYYAVQAVWTTSPPSPLIRLQHTTFCLLPFAFCLLICFSLLGWYNAARFGDFLSTGYHFDSGEGFTTPILQGLWGLLGSPYRGVFWHTPLFLASLFALIPFTRRHRAEGITIIALSAALIGLYSAWWMWWGGFAWGPRFLVPLGPFWVLPLAAVLERDWEIERLRDFGRQTISQSPNLPISLGILAFLSGLIQLAAVTVNYVNYEIQLRDIFPTDWADPLKFGPPAQGIGDFAASPVIGQFRLMAQDFLANTDLAWLRADGTILWGVVLTGVVVVGFLIGLIVRWFGNENRATPIPNPQSPIPLILALAAPLIFVGVWLNGASTDPIYGAADVGYRAILSEIERDAGADDAIVTIAPFHYQIPMNWYDGKLPIFGYATDSMDHAEAVNVLSRAVDEHEGIWFVTAGLPPADPANSVERWLADHAYKATDGWYDDFRLVRYGTAAGDRIGYFDLDHVLTDDANRVEITGFDVPYTIQARQVLAVDLHFRLTEPATHDLRWFVQMLGPDGIPVAMLDTGPLDGYTTFSTLPAGEELTEKAGLALSADLPPGDYRLIAGLYNPGVEGSPRLRSERWGEDAITLRVFTISKTPSK